MSTATLAVVAVGALFALVILPARQRRLARGSGARAQLLFRRANEARVRELLGPTGGTVMVDVPRSPWMEIEFDDRHARMVAARIETGELQAGVQLLDWRFGDGLQVWHTGGGAGELDVPRHLTPAQVREVDAVVTQLRDERVDSLAAPTLHAPHLLRIRFDDLDDLVARLPRVAVLLGQLEELVAPTLPVVED